MGNRPANRWALVGDDGESRRGDPQAARETDMPPAPPPPSPRICMYVYMLTGLVPIGGIPEGFVGLGGYCLGIQSRDHTRVM
uniref:Uncharacterized protein n=1 Tax=Haemonchus contortus TaxID=6289 RepID=A0A7I5EA32_HAECO